MATAIIVNIIGYIVGGYCFYRAGKAEGRKRLYKDLVKGTLEKPFLFSHKEGFQTYYVQVKQYPKDRIKFSNSSWGSRMDLIE